MGCHSRCSPCESSPPLPFVPVPRWGKTQKCHHLSSHFLALLSDSQWNRNTLKCFFTLRSLSSSLSFFIFSNSATRAASSSLSSPESSSSSSCKYKNPPSSENLIKTHRTKCFFYTYIRERVISIQVDSWDLIKPGPLWRRWWWWWCGMLWKVRIKQVLVWVLN